ncbi:MAG: peptide chain release factor N(5)-glutamine methyltransferase [Actinobacteria bacterium]|nr:peptide chain release factor N(5)-glutamine methyltransferase [Actinomycetota bacterium]
MAEDGGGPTRWLATSSARQAVWHAVERLENVGVPEPAASAEVLLAELLGVRRSELASYPGPLSEEQAALYEGWISRRVKREPVQRILGYAYFRNLRLELDEHALIPRPDTESVVDAALEAVDRRDGSCRVLDVGTGSGTISISIAQERSSCDVHATDYSEGALWIARRNAERAGAKVRFHRADLTSGLDALEGSVELLVSNPPYVRSTDIPDLAPEVRDWDPHPALDGGPDGLDFYRRIFAGAAPLLADGADVVLEVGDEQAEEVLEIGRCAGYIPLGTHPDLAGTPRAALLRWGSS